MSDLPSDGALRVILHWVSEGPLELMRSSRLATPTAVAVESRVIAFDPDRATLGDLLAAASLLANSVHAPFQYDADGQVPASEVRAAAARARARLRRHFPRLALPPRLASRTVATRDELKIEPLAPELDSTVELDAQSIGGVHLDGTGADAAQVLEWIHAGRIQERPDRLFSSLSIIDLPVTVAFAPLDETALRKLHEELAHVREAAGSITACMTEKAQDNASDKSRPTLTTNGAEIAPARLHDAYIAARVGKTPAVFRAERRDEDWFDPRRMLGVVVIDLAAFNLEFRLRASPRFAALAIATAFRFLEGPTEILVFENRLIERKRKPKNVVVHMVHRVCAAGDPVDDRVLARLQTLVARAKSDHLGDLVSAPHLDDVDLANIVQSGVSRLRPSDILVGRLKSEFDSLLAREIECSLESARDLHGSLESRMKAEFKPVRVSVVDLG